MWAGFNWLFIMFVPSPMESVYHDIVAAYFVLCLCTKLKLFDHVKHCRSRGSSVGIATGYGLDDRRAGVPSPGRVKNFIFSW
jgi:hypothetical protein